MILVKSYYKEVDNELVKKLETLCSNVEKHGNIILCEVHTETDAILLSTGLYNKYDAEKVVIYRTEYKQEIPKERLDFGI
jgi:hypothetical protein|nr:MAG TPA: hypothetical protein [Inoviridae sp.]